MPSVSLSPVFNGQVVTDSGDPASGWKLSTYLAGSSTLHPAYTDSTGTVAHTNPIIINALGFPTLGEIWLEDGIEYKFVLTDANDVLKRTVDDISGVNDLPTSTVSQWVASGLTPTYVSPTAFSLVGDQVAEFHVGRRVQAKQGVSYVYGTISASSFASGLTTVTLQMDAPGVLNVGLSEVNFSLLRADHHALPKVALDLVSLNVDGAINAANVAVSNTLTAATANITTLNMSGPINKAAQATLPSATNMTLASANADSILVTGTTTIQSFGVAPAGVTKTLEFQSPLTLTYNATSLILPQNENLAVGAGDVLEFYSKGAGNWKCISYFSQDGVGVIEFFRLAANRSLSPAGGNQSIFNSTLPVVAGKNYQFKVFFSGTFSISGTSISGNALLSGTAALTNISFGAHGAFFSSVSIGLVTTPSISLGSSPGNDAGNLTLVLEGIFPASTSGVVEPKINIGAILTGTLFAGGYFMIQEI